MPLPRDYAKQNCSLARALEILGERWTLLIVRDAFYGVRRFGDFADHLAIPRASLADRLTSLVDEAVLVREGGGRNARYELTEKGLSLWPLMLTMVAWGDEHYAPEGPRRLFVHATDDGALGPGAVCAACGTVVAPQDVLAVPGPGLAPPSDDDDRVRVAMREPHRLLEPIGS